jgi:predicted membrane channel-forming protein YqfA (hemolysin III family)
MWIEPIVRFSFHVVGGMCLFLSVVMAIVLWRIPQGSNGATAWWAVLFFTVSGLGLILVARRLKRFSELPQYIDPEERDAPKP